MNGEKLWRVESKWFCAGFVSRDGKVIAAAPYLRKTILGRSVRDVLRQAAIWWPGCTLMEVESVSVITEVRMSVAKTINLGNYNNVRIESTVTVGRTSDNDTPEKMRDQALDEIAAALNDAQKDHLPKRRSGQEEGYT